LISRVVNAKAGKKKKNGKPSKFDPQWYISILGKYELDNLTPSDYVYSGYADTQQVQVNSFVALPATYVRRKNSKGASTMERTTIEQPINLVDGSSGSSGYLFINNSTRLERLRTIWNDWVIQFTPFSSPLTVVSRDLGVNIACSAGMNRSWLPLTVDAKKLEADFVDMRTKKFVHVGTSPYATRQAEEITSHGPLLSGPTESILSQWILPQYQIQVLDPSAETASAPTRIQGLLGEPYSLSQTVDGETGVTLESLHDSYASKMAKGRDSEQSDWDAFFAEQTKLGHAGILSGLAAGLIGQFFGSQAGDIANSVASIIPI